MIYLKSGSKSGYVKQFMRQQKNAVEKTFPELDDNKKRLLIFKHEMDMYLMLAPTIESSDEKTNEKEEK